MKFGRFYTLFIILFFAAFAVVFNTFPRSVYSPLEKRELAQFPTFTWARLQSGAFTRDVSAWFSDSEPFRDHFMTLSMEVKHRLALSTGEENITFHAATPDPETAGGNGSSANDLEAGASNPDIEPYRNNLTTTPKSPTPASSSRAAERMCAPSWPSAAAVKVVWAMLAPPTSTTPPFRA